MQINKLYKYRPWDQYTKEILRNHTLHFSHPIDFNDPFDCQFTLDITANGEPELQTDQGGLSRETMENIRLHFGVCCFSAVNNDILLWSHYADGHRGVCLEFQRVALLSQAEPVIYKSTYPQVSMLSSIHEAAKLCMLTKYNRWAYEQEYRIVLPMGSGKVRFEISLLTGIILGCCIPQRDKEEILAILKTSGQDIQLYQANIKKHCFGLVILETN